LWHQAVGVGQDDREDRPKMGAATERGGRGAQRGNSPLSERELATMGLTSSADRRGTAPKL
jgi:hypothetical protein